LKGVGRSKEAFGSELKPREKLSARRVGSARRSAIHAAISIAGVQAARLGSRAAPAAHHYG